MKKYFILLVLVSFSIISFGAKVEIPILKEKKFNFTNEEIKFINDLHSKGELRLAITVNGDTYVPLADGSAKGFHYNVVKEFADLLDVKLKPNIVKEWNNYFEKKGKDVEKAKTDSTYSYSPDLFNDNDIYVAGMTSLPWREKLFTIVKFIPSKQMIIFRKDSTIKKIEDLDGKVVALVKGSSMESNVIKIGNEKKINIKIVHVENFEDMEKYVNEKKADCTIHDSDNAYLAIRNYKNLTVGFPVSELEFMGWGVEKNNNLLKSILEKYFAFARTNGIMDKYWKESYGIAFSEYINVLDYK